MAGSVWQEREREMGREGASEEGGGGGGGGGGVSEGAKRREREIVRENEKANEL